MLKLQLLFLSLYPLFLSYLLSLSLNDILPFTFAPLDSFYNFESLVLLCLKIELGFICYCRYGLLFLNGVEMESLLTDDEWLWRYWGDCWLLFRYIVRIGVVYFDSAYLFGSNCFLLLGAYVYLCFDYCTNLSSVLLVNTTDLFISTSGTTADFDNSFLSSLWQFIPPL